MRKRLISFCLIVSLFAGNTTAFASTTSVSNNNLTQSAAVGKKSGTDLTTSDLAKIQKCIIRNANGTLKLDKNAALKLGYEKSILDQLETYFLSLNKRILSGELKTDKNLVISDSKSVQVASNINSDLSYSKSVQAVSNVSSNLSVTYYTERDQVIWNWWGMERYANHSNALYIANQFTTLGFSAGGLGAVNKAVKVVFKYTMPEACLALAAIGGPYFGFLGYRIRTCAQNTGIYLRLTWVGIFSVRSQ